MTATVVIRCGVSDGRRGPHHAALATGSLDAEGTLTLHDLRTDAPRFHVAWVDADWLVVLECPKHGALRVPLFDVLQALRDGRSGAVFDRLHGVRPLRRRTSEPRRSAVLTSPPTTE
ncbi:MAG TPA: hypothetical protein VJ979_12095 [Actinomycetota bacterium]|nr:hypothetical protein [Actinomycetota bacterium]